MNNPDWKQIPGKLKHVSINNNRLYGVGPNNVNSEIYKADNYKSPNWVKVNGLLKQVDLNNNLACGVNSNNEIFCSDNDSEYQKLPGNLKYISVNKNRRLYGVGADDSIYTSQL